MRLIAPTVLLLAAGLLMAQAPDRDERGTTSQVCHATLANPPGFDPFQFIPKEVDFKQLNRFPKVTYVVNKDGSVSDFKILKGTGSRKVDAGVIKSIEAWKYKLQPGCTFEVSASVVIDIGMRWR